MVMWDEVAAQVAKDFPEVQVDKMLVDAMTCRMVLQPNSLDTIVATNLVSVAQRSVMEQMLISTTARGHSLRPCGSSGRLHRHRTNIKLRPDSAEP